MDDTAHAGEVSGRIYAISTLGSFIGTFLPTLVFIPAIGTTKTFLLFSLVLLFVALAGLGMYSSRSAMLKLLWMPAVLAIVAMIWSGQALKRNSGTNL